MRLPATVKWLLFFTFAAVAAAGAAAAWLVNHWEGLLRDRLFSAFNEAAPGLVLYVDDIRLPGTSTL
jgi:hypothetical protein